MIEKLSVKLGELKRIQNSYLKLFLVIDGTVQRRVQTSNWEFFLCVVSEPVIIRVQVWRVGSLVTPTKLATFEKICVLARGVATNFTRTHPFENSIPLFTIFTTTIFGHL